MQVLNAGLSPTRLQLIAISHFHGDHVNGLPGFLGTLGLNGHKDPLTLASPPGLDRYLATLRDLSILRPSFPIHLVDNARSPVFVGDDFTVTSCPVEHRVPTWAYLFAENDRTGRFDVDKAVALGVKPGPDFGALQRGKAVTTADGLTVTPEQVLGPTRAGRRVAYVTDTRPCAAAVELARNADILIHESTYLSELKAQAIDRRHSTVSEAARIAAEAGVGKLILTHISPKHGRGRDILREARAIFENTELAEDLAVFELPVTA